MARYYSSIAQEAELTAPISAAATTMTVDSLVGWPASTPFTAVVDPGTASEEIVTVTSVGGTTMTVVRGEDGSSPIDHDAGAAVRHLATGRDLREPQEHIDASSNVHGVGLGNEVVGTGTTQTLTNKTISGAANTFQDVPQSAVTGLITALTDLDNEKSDVGHTHSAADITSGTLAEARVPDLPASKISSGVFSSSRIPSLDASKVTSGTFGVARIPNLPASQITSGTLAAARIPTITASMVDSASGTISAFGGWNHGVTWDRWGNCVVVRGDMTRSSLVSSGLVALCAANALPSAITPGSDQYGSARQVLPSGEVRWFPITLDVANRRVVIEEVPTGGALVANTRLRFTLHYHI